ncbi:sulfatase [Bacteroidota bacterium]
MYKNKNRLIAYTGIGAALIAGTLSCDNSAKKKMKSISEDLPNIIFIMADDLGWKDVGVYGSKFYETPNINRLAADGMMFTNAYAPASNCAPSRACILTGQNTPRHGIYTVSPSARGNKKTRKIIPIKNTKVLADEKITIAEILKKNGYKTASFGKWHLGDDPCTQGFDINIGGNIAGHPKSYFSPYKNTNIQDGPEGEYLTDRITNEAISFIENNKTNPFFLYIPYFAVHSPLQPKQDLLEKYKSKEVVDGQKNAKYAAMIEAMDYNIGNILDKLDELNLSDNTIVVFFSDNGGIAAISPQTPLRAGKGSYYEGGIKEPLIIKWPAKIKAAQMSDEIVSGLDFFPTFLKMAEIDISDELTIDGESIMPILLNKGKLKRKALYWHFPIYLEAYNQAKDDGRDPLFRTRPGTVMRMGDWKLHEYFEDGGLELYNLKNDPGERINLANENAEVLGRLHKMMKKWREDINAPVPVEKNPDYDPTFKPKKR